MFSSARGNPVKLSTDITRKKCLERHWYPAGSSPTPLGPPHPYMLTDANETAFTNKREQPHQVLLINLYLQKHCLKP